jgi:hypothetical protein
VRNVFKKIEDFLYIEPEPPSADFDIIESVKTMFSAPKPASSGLFETMFSAPKPASSGLERMVECVIAQTLPISQIEKKRLENEFWSIGGYTHDRSGSLIPKGGFQEWIDKI